MAADFSGYRLGRLDFAGALHDPLASLVSTDDTGFPVVTHLPLQLQEQGGERMLLGHCARANPHWRYLAERPEALVTFMGPSADLSPSVYPDLARVPSWNYLAVPLLATE